MTSTADDSPAFSLPGPLRGGRKTGNESTGERDPREDGGCAHARQSLQRRGAQYTGSPTSPRRTFVVGRRANLLRQILPTISPLAAPAAARRAWLAPSGPRLARNVARYPSPAGYRAAAPERRVRPGAEPMRSA